MFEYQGPRIAAEDLAEFRAEFGAKLPDAQNEKLREIIRTNPGAPPRVMAGMEILYAVAVEKPPSTVGAKKALFETLYKQAQAWAMGQWISPEATQRAEFIQAWAAHQLSPAAAEPPQPDVDPAYTTIAPPQVDPAAIPAAPAPAA